MVMGCSFEPFCCSRTPRNTGSFDYHVPMKTHSPWSRFVALTLAAFFSLSPLLEARVEPKHGFDIFSQDEEIQLGKQNAADVMKQMPVLPDSDPVTQYVQKLGARLAQRAPGY